MTKPFGELSAFDKLREVGRNAEADLRAIDIITKFNDDKVRLDLALMVIEKMAGMGLYTLMNAMEKQELLFDPEDITTTFYKNVRFEISKCIERNRAGKDEAGMEDR